MAEEGKEGKAEETKKIVHTYPLVRHSDMPEEMRTEAMELVATACEKFSNSNEAASKMIKEEMDKKFGPPFHVVVGEGFGFEISYECTTLLYMFFGGNLAICVWKC
ncbi:dynein light chain 4, axonemal [Anoplophora glabripennis]|uniref:dynein light chain 4, axonemal n=1 Tax=Anoplophora glabripennis TaxID=217634 RepID=UPI00087494D5|nr:dynein light chain 4, axonemal [Anoplophora glabripennis]